MLLVTHACKRWDQYCTTKIANQELVALARASKVPIVFLQEDLTEAGYFCPARKGETVLKSQRGELPEPLYVWPSHWDDGPTFASRKIVSTGGYFSACQQQTIRTLVARWANTHDSYDLYLPLDAIYDAVALQRNLVAQISKDALPRLDALIKEGKTRKPLSESELRALSRVIAGDGVPLSQFLEKVFVMDGERLRFLQARFESQANEPAFSRMRSSHSIQLVYRGQTLEMKRGESANSPRITLHAIDASDRATVEKVFKQKK